MSAPLGFKTGRSLPILVVALLVLLAAALYIQSRFNQVQQAITTSDPRVVTQATDAAAVTSPPQRPPLADPALLRQQEEDDRRAASIGSDPPKTNPVVEPDRPVVPDAPLKH
jgi:hypothetical protein